MDGRLCPKERKQVIWSLKLPCPCPLIISLATYVSLAATCYLSFPMNHLRQRDLGFASPCAWMSKLYSWTANPICITLSLFCESPSPKPALMHHLRYALVFLYVCGCTLVVHPQCQLRAPTFKFSLASQFCLALLHWEFYVRALMLGDEEILCNKGFNV